MDSTDLNCPRDVYCRGPLLDHVQRSGLYTDCKEFVDKPLAMDPDVVLASFHDLLEKDLTPSREELQRFVDKHFLEAFNELETWTPDDWKEKPELLEKIQDSELRRFASELNDLWKILGRKIKPLVHPSRHSILTVPNPFIIPGDRFQEYYYWDSYWIVGGLLAVGMEQTVRGMLENFLHIVDRLGFIPNGGRIYYTDRSQPPLLIPMISQYYAQSRDKQFLQENIHTLEKEYNFWVTQRMVEVKGHKVAQYGSDEATPRPESYRPDAELTQGMQAKQAEKVYTNLRAACESGWDFSTRWFNQSKELKTVKTKAIVPVDLNAYLCWNEQILADFFALLGNHEKQHEYQSLASKRREAIDTLFWDEQSGVWFDLDLETAQKRKSFFPSNLFPLFANATNKDKTQNAHKILSYLKSQGVYDFPGGVPTTLVDSGQQWDFPNAWSPLVHFFVESLDSLGTPEARQLAEKIALNWVLSNLEAWKEHRKMFEKYDVTKFGSYGGGGEYKVQVGFGWTNGVILMILEKYAGKL